MTREIIEQKIEAYTSKLVKKTDFKVNFAVVSKTKPDLIDIKKFMTDTFLCSDFIVADREKTITFYRHMFCYFAFILGYNDEQIANFIKRDRTSILHAKKKITSFLEIKDKMTVECCQILYTKILEEYGKDIFRPNFIQRYLP